MAAGGVESVSYPWRFGGDLFPGHFGISFEHENKSVNMLAPQ
jgi:hypothetical protein